jgi:hypothetical protein
MSFKRDACDVLLSRMWDRALVAGGPVQVKGSRPVTVGSRQTDLYAMSGFGLEFQQLGLEGSGYDVKYIVTLRFTHCTDADLDDALPHVVFHW